VLLAKLLVTAAVARLTLAPWAEQKPGVKVYIKQGKTGKTHAANTCTAVTGVN